MEPSKTEERKEKKTNKAVDVLPSPLCSVTKTRCSYRDPAFQSTTPPLTAPEPVPMEEDVIPDTAYLLQRRRVHVKEYFCKHCPDEPISSSSPRWFDWQGLTAHMKARSVCDSTRGAVFFCGGLILLTSLRALRPGAPASFQAFNRQTCRRDRLRDARSGPIADQRMNGPPLTLEQWGLRLRKWRSDGSYAASEAAAPPWGLRP